MYNMLNRQRVVCALGIMAALAVGGCGGLDIKPLTVAEAENAHKTGSDENESGYIVYHPMIVVEVTKGEGNKCVMGKPQILPDYGKPFLLKITQGIGKSRVDLRIEDGWRLGGVKTESDNTALLEFVAKTAGLVPGAVISSTEIPEFTNSCKPGLYKLSLKDNNDTTEIKLKPINISLQ